MTNLAAEQQREKEQTEKYFRPVEGETDYPATVSQLLHPILNRISNCVHAG